MNSTNQLKNFKYKLLNRFFKLTYSPSHNSFDQTQRHYYSKSFNPHFDYPDQNQPVTPQNYDLTVQVQALPFSEHQWL
jgi:hypothetical protein